MELTEIEERLTEMRPEDDSDEDKQVLAPIVASVGDMAEAALLFEQADEGDERVQQARANLVSGLVIAAMDYAVEYDIDVGEALDDRLDALQKQMEQQEKIREAMEEGDAKAMADALGADANEVPTGDDEDPRGFA